MMARILRELGVHMGADCSTLGESDFFRRLNMLILYEVGASWHEPTTIRRALADATQRDALVAKLRRAVGSRARAKYLGSSDDANKGIAEQDHAWGWKDPRTTLTLPLWRHVFRDASVIHIVRNGVDVAQSLMQRERMGSQPALATLRYVAHRAYPWRWPENKWRRFRDLDEAFGLWAEYVRFGLDATALLDPDNLFVIRYEDVLSHSSRATSRLAAFLGTKLSATQLKRLAACRTFCLPRC